MLTCAKYIPALTHLIKHYSSMYILSLAELWTGVGIDGRDKHIEVMTVNLHKCLISLWSAVSGRHVHDTRSEVSSYI